MQSQPQKDLVRDGADFGALGSLFMLTLILAPAGLILLLIALYKLSRAYGNKAIWRNMLYAFIVRLPIYVLLILIVLAGLILPLSIIIFDPYLYPLEAVSGWFMRRSFNELKVSSNVEEFGKTAMWIWLGALTSIIPIVGIALAWIGYYHARKGFKELENLQ